MVDSFLEWSSREQEVLDLLLEGKSNKQIASALHISVHTVEFHLKNIYAKAGVSSRTELFVKLRNSVVAEPAEKAENRDKTETSPWLSAVRDTFSTIRKEFKLDPVSFSSASSPNQPLTFFDAIRVCLRKYAEFEGRASRAEFWWFMLFVLLVSAALVYVHETLGSIFLIAVLLPLLAAGARRLRDCGKNPWWLLFLLAPVGGIVTLSILWAQPSLSPQPESPPAA